LERPPRPQQELQPKIPNEPKAVEGEELPTPITPLKIQNEPKATEGEELPIPTTLLKIQSEHEAAEGEELPIPTTPPKSERSPSPIAAATLSFFSGGLGQLLLLGQWKKGLTLILLFLFSLFIPILGFLLAPLIIIIGVGDAYGTAQKLRAGSTVKDWALNINWKASAAVVVLIIILAMFIVLLFSL
jgi:hypothetical protein